MAKAKPTKKGAARPAAETIHPEAAATDPGGQVLRQGNAPICTAHQVPMVAKHSDPYFTRYYCPEPGCRASLKVPRPRLEQRLARDRQAAQFDARAES